MKRARREGKPWRRNLLHEVGGREEEEPPHISVTDRVGELSRSGRTQLGVDPTPHMARPFTALVSSRAYPALTCGASSSSNDESGGSEGGRRRACDGAVALCDVGSRSNG
ncbi:hypothetical protein GW17_00029440 [Ensete ventricosum]|nr:hypothetical protein GW17_00029440 [Ensete ventricosum]RZS22298.1 hypothetical protein BHM03_00055050 [Ensete ventricosum]